MRHHLSLKVLCTINIFKCIDFVLYYFSSAITNHPQVLRALKGVNFKETGCYLPPTKGVVRADNPNHRMNCFPFVERRESSFIFGDATVTYSGNFEVPYYLQQDNPHIKSIFVIRNPIRRLESHFRFSLGKMKSIGFMTIDEMVIFALRNGSQLHSLFQSAEGLLQDINNADHIFVNGPLKLDDCLSVPWVLYFRFDECVKLSNQSDIVDVNILHKKNKISEYVASFFQPRQFETGKDRIANMYFRTSIYFPGINCIFIIVCDVCLFTHELMLFIAIVHWCEVLKPQNVIIVENEELKLSTMDDRHRVEKELKRIHRCSD